MAFLSECDCIFFVAKGQTRSWIDRRQASLPHIRRLYAAYHRIGKHILHLCGGSSADLIIDAACAVTVAQHGVSAVGT